MSSGGFGIPLPLPGQKEKRVVVRESERLQMDALKMEERLEKLKVQASKEKDRRDSTSKVGGATWRSARGDTTTAIRGYAKEVQRQVMLSKSMASATLASASLPVRRDVRRPAASLPPPGASSSNSHSSPNLGSGGFNDRAAEVGHKDPMSWSVRDTTAWLCSQGLQQYQDRFAKNEISGPILMEIGLDDLDYMGITVLAHRKILLRGVEELRHGGRSSQPPPPPQASATQRRPPNEAIGSPTKLRPILQQATKKNEKVLFSRARRINGSMDSADEEGLGRVMHPSNQRQGAEESLGQGEYDESQARQSFQDALREWRSAGKRGNDDGASSAGGAPLEREASPETESESGQGDDGMWRNPFATPREGHSQPPTKDNKAAKGQGGQLWGRLPDEKEEHQSFMEAVDAWRRGRRGDTESVPAPPSSSTSSHLPTPLSLPTPRLMSEAGTNTPRTAATPMSLPIARSNNDTADEGSSPVIKARRNVQEMADRIANQLDEEHRQCREQLAKQKDEYMRRLAAAQIDDDRSREEEAKRHAAQSTPTAEAEGKDSGEEKGHDEKGRGAKGMDEDEEQRGQGLTDAEDKASLFHNFQEGGSPARNPCEDKLGSASPQDHRFQHLDEAEASYGEQGVVIVEEAEEEEVRSSVRIEEVGTIMGYTPRRDTGEEEGDYCVVEECDSEEEEQGRREEGDEGVVSF